MTPRWEYDAVLRGWRVVYDRDGVRYQSAAMHTKSDSLFARTLVDMQHAKADQWRIADTAQPNVLTLPATL